MRKKMMGGGMMQRPMYKSGSTVTKGNIRHGKLKSQKELKKITDSKEYKKSDFGKKTKMLNVATMAMGGRVSKMGGGMVPKTKGYFKGGKTMESGAVGRGDYKGSLLEESRAGSAPTSRVGRAFRMSGQKNAPPTRTYSPKTKRTGTAPRSQSRMMGGGRVGMDRKAIRGPSKRVATMAKSRRSPR